MTLNRCVSALMLILVMNVMVYAQSLFVAYPCRNQTADTMAKLLQPHVSQQNQVQIVVDNSGKRLLVSGPESIHTVVRRIFQESDVPAGVTRRMIQPTGLQTLSSPTLANESFFVRLPRGRVEALQQRLAAVFGVRFQAAQPNDGTTWLLSVRGLDQPVRFQFDLVRSGVQITGASSTSDQLRLLVAALIAPKESNYRTQVFRLDRRQHVGLRGAISTINSDQPQRFEMPDSQDQGRIRIPAGAIGSVKQVVFQNPDPSEGSPAIDQAGQAVPQFEGVEIESLPDLDVIILRGRDPDLEKLADVIKQLERISQETQPEIRVLPLNHASSETIAAIIAETSDDLIAGRQGKVSVTPLVKPNALLLIGWGDAVKAIVQLSQQLDAPVAADTQSSVFRLKHALAETVGETIQDFLSGREGMGPQVQVAIDPRTNSLIVYASPRDLKEVAKLVEDLDQPGGKSVHHTRIFPIQNALAADVAETLELAISEQSSTLALEVMDSGGRQLVQSGSLDQVKITPNPRNNTLIVTSPLENMQLIQALIRQLDTPSGQVQLKIFQIINGDAASMVETLRSLLPSESDSTGTTIQLSTAAGETSLAPLRFSVDLRSNSIIATGSEGDLRIVEALLLRLDQSTDQQRKSTVVQLKNAPAVDVASAINQYLLNQRQIEAAIPGDRNPFQEIEREVVVVPEPIANKLILAATPRYYDEIKALIDKLDEQPPQVLIQVMIAEVALDSLNEFGIELGVQSSVLFDRSLLGDLLTTTNSTQTSTPGGVTTVTEELIRAATNVPGFIFNSTDDLGNSGSSAALGSAGVVGGQGISNFAVGRRNDDRGFGGLVLSASSQNVSVLLRALSESRHVQILSRPQVRTLDNQPAFIQVGQRVPRIVGSTVNQNGQSNSVTLENVGLILGVTPRVSPDNTVVMEIDAERSKLGEEIDGVPVAVSIDGTVIRSPRIDTITAQATVSAANGETIILGGLISEDRRGVHRRVPILKDIPILRNLFKFDSEETRRAELLVILTPHVIRSMEDNERLKQIEIARMHWCERDVYRIHGDINVTSVAYEGHFDAANPPVIYPDLNPTGEMESVVVESFDDAPTYTRPTPYNLESVNEVPDYGLERVESDAEGELRP